MQKTFVGSMLLLALITFSSGAQVARSATFVGGTGSWTIVSQPVVGRVAGNPGAVATFANHLDVPVLGIVILVLHNAEGQTVLISAGTVSINPGSLGTAYLVAFGLPTGSYSANVFAISTAGVALSNSTNFPFLIT